MTDRNNGQYEPLPETAELGGEGGSYGDNASRQSREQPADGPDRVRDQAVDDSAGYATRLPNIRPDADAPTAGDELLKQPTE